MKFFLLPLLFAFSKNECITQSDTLFFTNFESVKTTSVGSVKYIVVEGGQFSDAAPFLDIGSTTSNGQYNQKSSSKIRQYNFGKGFLYHSPTWFLNKLNGLSYNHIQLKLNQPLSANKTYLIRFETGLFKNFKSKPAHYGIKFSQERIIKETPGGLLSGPDIFFSFIEDLEKEIIQAVFTSSEEINFIYFGCFKEDSSIISKRYLDMPGPPGIAIYNDSLLSRVALDNLLIKSLNPEPETFKDIYFDFDKDTPSDTLYINTLISLSKFLQSHDDHLVLIQGYTDLKGSTKYNVDLSQRRAQTIKTELIGKGIPENRIVTLGKGKHAKVNKIKDEQMRKVSILVFQ